MSPERTEALLPGRVLLVEDGRDNQRLLAEILTEAGATVVTAENGQIAIEAVAHQQFDLILMDMQMPVMDGHMATAELRRQGVNTPILGLTASSTAKDRAQCLASGCDAYLSKPADEETLLQVLSRLLAGSRRN